MQTYLSAGGRSTWPGGIHQITVWRGRSNSAEKYIAFLNSNDLNLKFCGHISDTSVVYLDLEVYVADRNILTRLYWKPTVGNSVLHARSFHPRNMINNIPYRELLRLKHNCTTSEEYLLAKAEEFTHFLKQGILIPGSKCS